MFGKDVVNRGSSNETAKSYSFEQKIENLKNYFASLVAKLAKSFQSTKQKQIISMFSNKICKKDVIVTIAKAKKKQH